MKPARPFLLIVSALVVVVLLGGGLAMKVGAEENSYRQVVVFSEVLSLVMDNYVDPVDSEALLNAAYEGMLGGLDANGAYLSAEAVAEWKKGPGKHAAGPGISVLKAGSALQVVAVEPGSSAEAAGIEVGDHLRKLDGRLIGELSLMQASRLLRGPSGSSVKLEVVHPREAFRREVVDVVRRTASAAPYQLDVKRGIAVLRFRDLARTRTDELAEELGEVQSRGVERLLLDLRNVVDLDSRSAVAVAGLFGERPVLKLRDRSGELVETSSGAESPIAWDGPLAALVNGATAGGSEALAKLLGNEANTVILGESTYGLGAEVDLYELEDGSGLLVSAAVWETGSGTGWNGDGIEPDEAIRGEGDDYAASSADQLERVLDYLEEAAREQPSERRAA